MGGPAGGAKRSVKEHVMRTNVYETPPISMKLRQFQDDMSSSLKSMKLLRGNQLSMVPRRLRAGFAGRAGLAWSTDSRLRARVGMMASTSSSTSAKALRSSVWMAGDAGDLGVVDFSSSSSLKLIKLLRRVEERGTRWGARERPSRQARASMRLLRRSRELIDSERNEAGRRARGVGESRELTTVEAGRFFNEGGGAGERGLGMVGSSGRVAEGAGFGEGMDRSDSFDARRRAGTTGTGDTITGFSVRLGGREKAVGRDDTHHLRKVINGFHVGGACPAGGLGEDGELASVGRGVSPVVREVEVEEGAELDGVALAGPEGEVDGRGIVGGGWG